MESRPRFLDEQLNKQTKIRFAETMNMNEIPTPETEMAYTPQPRESTYARFHAERRQKLLAYIEGRVAEHVTGGGNDSLSYRMDCAYDGMLTLPGHTDRSIWDAAWEACIAQSTKTALNQ